jgi:hypothetical protein
MFLVSGDRVVYSGRGVSIPSSRANVGCHFQGIYLYLINPGLKHLGCDLKPLHG